MEWLLQELLAGDRSVVNVKGLRGVARAAERAEGQGLLRRLLPSVYCATERVDDVAVRVAAAAAYDPDIIVTGRAAAALSWWPGLQVGTIDCYRGIHRPAPRGYRWLQGAVNGDLVTQLEQVRFTTVGLTVLDLIPDLGGDAIDEALRRRAVTLADIKRALDLTPTRRGNAERRWLVADSRDEPWSFAERRLHRIYRSLEMPFHYATNHRVQLEGRLAFLDLALPELLLDFEVDGYEHHGTREAFEQDRDRNSELASLGWQVVYLSAALAEHSQTVVSQRMRLTIEARARLFGCWPG